MRHVDTKEMYDVYLTTRSIRKTAIAFDTSTALVRYRFTCQNLPLTIFTQPDIQYNGRTYSLKRLYYRATTDPKTLLHFDMWEDEHGPLREKEYIYFIDKDCTNFELSNLAIVPRILRPQEIKI